MNIDIDAVTRAARNELQQELFRQAVETEKERLRSKRNKSLWQRLIDKLPFTITRKQ